MPTFEGYIFAPKPFYGRLVTKRERISNLSTRREPKRITRLILPGFISTHIHTVQTHARNTAENLELLDWLKKVIWPFEASLNSRSAYESSLDGMKECLSKGITTILDMATTRHTDSIFHAAQESGIRGFIGKALMDVGPRSLVEKKPLDEIPDLLDRWHGRENGRLQVTLCPRFALSCSRDLLIEVGRLSRELKLLHHSHASENRAEVAEIQKISGKSNVSYLDSLGNLNDRTILAHCVHLSDSDIRILRQRRVAISHCPTSNLKLASGLADLTRFREIPVSLGVDGAACNNLLDPFFEMRLSHLLSRYLHGLAGVSAKRIFEFATIGGAQALRSESEIGSLEKDKQADLVIVRVPDRVAFNPKFPYESLIHSITSADIEAVFVQGCKVFSN